MRNPDFCVNAGHELGQLDFNRMADGQTTRDDLCPLIFRLPDSKIRLPDFLPYVA